MPASNNALTIGLKARTGRAILVALAGDAREPIFVARAAFKLLPEGAWAPYHAAEKLAPAEARKSVKRDVSIAHRLAVARIGEAAERFSDAGYDLVGCAVLVGTGMPNWTTDEIIAVHVRMHKAEGELFRDVLVAGARACGLALTTLPEKSALDDAAKALGVTRASLDATIALLGKSAGSPWRKDEKDAAAAALVAHVAHATRPARGAIEKATATRPRAR